MALWIALGVVLAAVGVMWAAVGLDPGPSPADVAVGYESAWDRLDFSTLFDLSGDELRDGLNRDGFVAARRNAHASGSQARRVDRIEVEDSSASGDTAHVVTALHAEGSIVQNDLVLRRRNGRWVVSSYVIRPERAER
jgi:hypothetical protein